MSAEIVLGIGQLGPTGPVGPSEVDDMGITGPTGDQGPAGTGTGVGSTGPTGNLGPTGPSTSSTDIIGFAATKAIIPCKSGVAIPAWNGTATWIWKSASGWNSSTGIFTAPEDGIYTIDFVATYGSLTATPEPTLFRYAIRISDGGALNTSLYGTNSDNIDPPINTKYCHISLNVALQASYTVYAYPETDLDDGTDITVSDSTAYFSINKIGNLPSP